MSFQLIVANHKKSYNQGTIHFEIAIYKVLQGTNDETTSFAKNIKFQKKLLHIQIDFYICTFSER